MIFTAAKSPGSFPGDLVSLLLIFLLFTPGMATMTFPQFRQRIQESDSQAPRTENIDPNLANPVRNITCVGDKMDLYLPMLGPFDPNQVTMQKLCAKPQYNGGAPGWNAGGYCTEPPFPPYTGDLAFDASPEAGASPVLQNPRVLLTCQYRCFCNWGVTDRSVQPKTHYLSRQMKVQLRPSRASYQLRLDIDDDFTTPRAQKGGRFGSMAVDTLRLLTGSQLSREGRYLPQSHRLFEYVSLDPGNKISCGGPMPTFELPAPYSRLDFINIRAPNPVQHLCAMQLSGGHKGANAGGYCHRSYQSSTPSGPRSEVWFSDDMTPRLDWTWTGDNFFASASIRFFCQQRCSCANELNKNTTTKNPAAKNIWSFLPGHQLFQDTNGALYFQTLDPMGVKASVQVLPPQYGPGSRSGTSRSGTCGVNGTSFCPYDWDAKTLGPPPIAPPNTTDIIKPVNNANATVCGNICHAPADCGSTSGGYNCSCAFPNSADARTLGLDPVAPAAVCLALFMTTVQSQLNGRDERGFVDARGLPHTCRCNETFVGDECCGYVNGMRQATLPSH